MGIKSFAEYFGCDDYDVFKEAQDAKDTAEGYIAGTQNAAMVHQMIMTHWGHRSRAFRESLLQALREQL